MRPSANLINSKWGKALSGITCITLLMLGGCEVNDFINPGEPQIIGKHSQPLTVPILDTIATGIEEPSSAYSGATEIQADDLVPQIADYQIGKNDLLSVSIYDLLGEGTGETVKQARVTESGNISLPYISPIKAEDLTENGLEQSIIKAYADAKLIRQARVAVTVVEARNRTFSIQGNVSSPGEFTITRPDYRMLDAMVAARAPTVAIGVPYAYVIRKLHNEAATKPSSVEDSTTRPSTAPGDLLIPQGLTPQGRATPLGNVQTAMLLDDVTTAIPATMPATMPASDLLSPAATTTERPAGMVEGQPAPVPGNTYVGSTTLTRSATSEPTGFQFNDLQAPTEDRKSVV